MSTTTMTNVQDDLRSRLPDPAEVFPDLAAVATGMTKATK